MNLLVGEIEDRSYRFESYGVAITRKQGRCNEVKPVWYLDISPGHDWLTEDVDRLIDLAVEDMIKDGATWDAQPIAHLAPFFEQMGAGVRRSDGQPYRKEFWWEREWRHVGHFPLPYRYIVLCPQDAHEELAAFVTEREQRINEEWGSPPDPSRIRFVDPAWSLEMIIGRLAGFETKDLGPF